jgi:hypothetical protein
MRCPDSAARGRIADKKRVRENGDLSVNDKADQVGTPVIERAGGT